jgi:hypothetical protein
MPTQDAVGHFDDARIRGHLDAGQDGRQGRVRPAVEQLADRLVLLSGT